MPAEDFSEYQAQLEQHEIAKETGLDAWAEAVTDMLSQMGNVDEDKAILIKQGLKAALGGPPRFNPPPAILGPFPPHQIPCPPVDAEFVKPEPHIFEQRNEEDGSVTCWDWLCLASGGTHATRYRDQSITIWRGQESIITLTGEAAERFWKWKTQAISGRFVVPAAYRI